MNIRNRAPGALLGLVALTFLAGGAVAADRSYKEGPVTVVSSIRTTPGHFDDYMAWLAGPWKQVAEAEKAAGLIVSYSVYTTTPRGPNDPDIYLLRTYKNMAALDDLLAKSDAIDEKIMGNQTQQNQATIDRGKLRTVIGSEMIREALLK